MEEYKKNNEAMTTMTRRTTTKKSRCTVPAVTSPERKATGVCPCTLETCERASAGLWSRPLLLEVRDKSRRAVKSKRRHLILAVSCACHANARLGCASVEHAAQPAAQSPRGNLCIRLNRRVSSPLRECSRPSGYF